MSQEKGVQLHTPMPIRILKHYVRIINTKIFFRSYMVRGTEHIPSVGTPTIVASNHQNCMLDPLAIIYPLHRYAKFLTRAGVFANPRIGRMLRKIGLLPAYRMDVDGASATENNAATWQTTEQELLGGQTVVIFPEGKHQHKRILGEFQSGYTRMAFDAAKASNFKTPIYILPTANHYSHYEHMQTDCLISFGEPLDISDYYELYQTKPRTAQRQVNAIIHKRIEDMMLAIADDDNYEAKEFAAMNYDVWRTETWGIKSNIVNRLRASQAINNALTMLEATQPEEAKQLFADILRLKKELNEVGLRTWVFCQRLHISDTIIHTLLMICGLIVFIGGLVPNIVIYAAPYLLTNRLADQRFRATLRLGISLVTIPIVYIAWFCTEYSITDHLLFSLIHTAILPLLGLWSWHYRIQAIKLAAKFKYHFCAKTKKFADIATLNGSIWLRLDELTTDEQDYK